MQNNGRRSAAELRAKRRAVDRAAQKTQIRSTSRARRTRIRAVTNAIVGWFAPVRAFLKRLSKPGRVIVGSAAAALILIPVLLICTSGGKGTQAASVPESSTQAALSGEHTAQELDLVAAAAPTATPLPTPTPEPHPDREAFKQGLTAPLVAGIQERLMELDYMDWDEPTQYYGPQTKASVRLFQRQHGLDTDGCVGADTYALLLSDEAQKYTVSIGVEGTDVKELQIRLRELGYMDKATELFGTETEAAVKKFQERNGLSSDGKVGEQTREMLYSEDAKANYFERGEVSEKLKTYQNKLSKLGYLTTTPDGKYGNDTENAVKRFQERNGGIADGYLGPATIELLMSSDAQANALMIGMKGSDIARVQERLKELNYLSGKADGYFGSKTESAVYAFQKRNSLSADGKVGKHTLSVLMSSKAKKASSSTPQESPSGDGGTSAEPPSSSGSSSSSGGGASSGGGTVDSFISIAKSKLGCKYVRGAKGPDRFDCSGFVYWCLNQAGVSQGYMTSSAWQKCTKYQKISSMSNLERGDVISFRGHVGIYLGGGQMIDASSGEGKIRISSNIQSSAYWKRNFKCGFRIF